MKPKSLTFARLIFFAVMLAASVQQAGAFSLALDSVAEWGKFPRFCVNTYRWGDRFFNSYDSTYVVGTGKKFNIKAVADSWFDDYNFRLPENRYMTMRTDASTSVGAYLTYLAVSAGYDINVSNLFGGVDRSRHRFRFGFNCALLAVELYFIKNDVGSTIRSFGYKNNTSSVNYKFNGINTNMWGFDGYYFFNNKRYSEAAAFNYSKVQLRNQGSWFLGFSVYNQKFHFNFASLPDEMKAILPSSWEGYRYDAVTTNYAVRVGYGYNWVPHHNLVVGVSESPVIGVRRGTVTGVKSDTSFSLFNRFKLSVVWNYNNRWFAGIIGKIDTAMVYDRDTALMNSVFSAEAAVGYRFNIW